MAAKQQCSSRLLLVLIRPALFDKFRPVWILRRGSGGVLEANRYAMVPGRGGSRVASCRAADAEGAFDACRVACGRRIRERLRPAAGRPQAIAAPSPIGEYKDWTLPAIDLIDDLQRLYGGGANQSGAGTQM
jgi:hypothetical protein